MINRETNVFLLWTAHRRQPSMADTAPHNSRQHLSNVERMRKIHQKLIIKLNGKTTMGATGRLGKRATHKQNYRQRTEVCTVHTFIFGKWIRIVLTIDAPWAWLCWTIKIFSCCVHNIQWKSTYIRIEHNRWQSKYYDRRHKNGTHRNGRRTVKWRRSWERCNRFECGQCVFVDSIIPLELAIASAIPIQLRVKAHCRLSSSRIRVNDLWLRLATKKKIEMRNVEMVIRWCWP